MPKPEVIKELNNLWKDTYRHAKKVTNKKIMSTYIGSIKQDKRKYFSLCSWILFLVRLSVMLGSLIY